MGPGDSNSVSLSQTVGGYSVVGSSASLTIAPLCRFPRPTVEKADKRNVSSGRREVEAWKTAVPGLRPERRTAREGISMETGRWGIARVLRNLVVITLAATAGVLGVAAGS